MLFTFLLHRKLVCMSPLSCLSRKYSNIFALGLNNHAIAFQYSAKYYPLSVYIYVTMLHDEFD